MDIKCDVILNIQGFFFCVFVKHGFQHHISHNHHAKVSWRLLRNTICHNPTQLFLMGFLWICCGYKHNAHHFHQWGRLSSWGHLHIYSSYLWHSRVQGTNIFLHYFPHKKNKILFPQTNSSDPRSLTFLIFLEQLGIPKLKTMEFFVFEFFLHMGVLQLPVVLLCFCLCRRRLVGRLSW